MDRQEIFELINDEREAQDKKWRTGRANEAQYQFAAPHILLVEEEVAMLRKEWKVSSYEEFQSRIVKIATCLVRALEEIKIKN